jgi:hypothetical protein
MAGNLENVGYCRPGKACIYNVDVMEETTATWPSARAPSANGCLTAAGASSGPANYKKH